jgi:hypothetical protein
VGNLADDSIKSQHLLGNELQLVFNSSNAMRIASVVLDPAKLTAPASVGP